MNNFQQPQCTHENSRQRHSIGAPPSDSMLERELLEMHRLRHSVPFLSAQDVPESILMRTGVRFVGITRRERHCVYSLQISTRYEMHLIHKRFSEFRDFRKELISVLQDRKSHCGGGPCAQLEQLSQVKFPRRRLHWPTREREMVIAQERLVALEEFVLATLCVYRMASRRHVRLCVNAQCRVATMIKRFLQVTDAEMLPVTPVKQQKPPTVDVAVEASRALPPLPYEFPLQPTRNKTVCRRSENRVKLFPICEVSE